MSGVDRGVYQRTYPYFSHPNVGMCESRYNRTIVLMGTNQYLHRKDMNKRMYLYRYNPIIGHIIDSGHIHLHR